MLNVYGYNRKTKEEDEAILAAVRRHHEIVEQKGYFVVMTSLVGSQNYDLDTETSDIDTFSLILPTLEELADASAQKAGLIFAEDGHCEFKDIRVALNLLQKTSPNSVEYFVSKYKVYNPLFEDILKEYLDDNTKMWDMVHCNYFHMLYAIAGMAHQLTKRNMPAGKRYSHALRLDDMVYHYLNSMNAGAVLDMRMGGSRDLALIAKRDEDPNNEEAYDAQCMEIADKLDTVRDNLNITDEQKATQVRGIALIKELQNKLFKKYLMETNI